MEHRPMGSWGKRPLGGWLLGHCLVSWEAQLAVQSLLTVETPRGEGHRGPEEANGGDLPALTVPEVP